ncbi:MAG: hypothetical protein IJ743_05310, partial [Bacilli bacterium]|nr:hypothetical protein [Bacilli bacterium]
MQYLDNEIIKKKYRNYKILMSIGLTILAIVILFTLGKYVFFKNDLGKPMNDYLLAKKIESDKKSYIKVIQEPIYIGSYSKEDKIYFLIKDENYSYVAKISNENYHKYQDATPENPIVMTGTTKEISETLMMAIINAINKDASEEEYVDAEWFVNYLGLMYLDEGEEPKSMDASLLILILVAILALVMFFTGWISKLRYEKNSLDLTDKEMKIINQELKEKTTKKYLKLQVYITKHYFVNMNQVFFAIPLENILWIYPFDVSNAGEIVSKALKIFTRDGKEYTGAKSDIEEKEFEKFYKDLQKDNSSWMIGYTKENRR